MKEEHYDLLVRLLPLHEFQMLEVLQSVEGIDLKEFFGVVQERKRRSETTNNANRIECADSPQTWAFLDTSQFISDCERIQNVILNLLKGVPINSNGSQLSPNACALALYKKNIVIDKQGRGVNDGIDYVAMFGIKPGPQLYNKVNDWQNDRKRETKPVKAKAEEIIKKYLKK